MQKIVIQLLAAILGCLLPQLLPAEVTLYLSNINQSSGGSEAVASDHWIAQRFHTGTNSGGYALSSIRLLMDQASAGANGFSANLYTVTGGYPANSLGSLSGGEPLTAGLHTFDATQLTLSPSTDYYLLVTAATPRTIGSFSWSKATVASFSSSEGWSLAPFSLASGGGSNWDVYRLLVLQFSVEATAIPEPATFALLGLGLVGLSFLRCRR